MIHDNHANQMMQIDNFVRTMCTPNDSLYFIYTEIERLSPNLQINLCEGLQYSAAVNIYVEYLALLRQIGVSSVGDLGENHVLLFKNYVLHQWNSVLVEDQRFRAQEQRNRRSLEQYLSNLLNHYARLLLVRIDFAIKADYKHEISIEQFHAWINQMSNRYSNKDGCFSGLQGYAWAIEQGLGKGFHCHTLLIYDGSKHKNDFGLALQVAQYWQQLTQDKGYCFISNDPEYKQQFECQGTLGIGMIHRNNPIECQNAVNAALYLVNPEKDHQNLSIRVSGMKTFGKGQFKTSKRRFSHSV